jgi:phenylpropionate dioxygenase-like ring-hydroxylating dioxygenase large terminal subunit
VTPIARELLAPSLDTFGSSSTLPAEAYTAESVFRWEKEHFFDRGWVCVGPDRTAVECEWLFSREAIEQESFDPSYASDFWDITNRQDWHACEAVQRGVSSRGYRRGPLSPREDAVYQLITMVANGYLEGRVARPASRTPTVGAIRPYIEET